MIVETTVIPQEVIDKVTVWACTQIHFTFGDLNDKLRRSRVDEHVAHTATDRFIKKWKKEGKIMFRKSQWHWQGV